MTKMFLPLLLPMMAFVCLFSACSSDDDTRTGTWEVKLYADSAKVMTVEGITRDFNIPDHSKTGWERYVWWVTDWTTPSR